MSKKLFQISGLEIWEEAGRYFAIYDAGAHVVQMRKDEISREEASAASAGEAAAVEMLIALQARLIANGINPYVSNFKE
jgi:hypothetical protein